MKNALRRVPLPVIVLAQLCGTSLWFSINGVWPSLARELERTTADLGRLTLAVQAGFILGTLSIAVSGLADRFRASHIFALASLLGAIANAGFVLGAPRPALALTMRFATGLCLAGIYPLGMKLVIAWTPRHAGATLSWLVGMLTIGTALPHLLRGATAGTPWAWPLLASSALALLGGLLVLVLGDGPHLPHPHKGLSLREGVAGLASPRFRAVAAGYFGHMWELYAFWMLTPLLVTVQIARLDLDPSWVPWVSFATIALGSVGCVAGGLLSRRIGSAHVARFALITSGLLCLTYPLLGGLPPALLLALLAAWGVAVITDSPQFSALAARAAPEGRVGATLAVMNAVGFALTIPAIWLTSTLWARHQAAWITWCLVPGPALALLAMRPVHDPKPEPGRPA